MLGKPFYNGHIRKFMIAFGSLFDDIKVSTINESGYIVKAMTVPIRVSGMDKTLINDNPDRQPYNEIYPRMAFEFIGINTNSNNRTNPNNSINGIKAPAPYSIDMGLYILAREMNDVFQIVEQIIPFFNPTLTITMENTPIKGQSIDVPITLTAISISDNYEGDESEPRRIEVTLNFSSTVNFYAGVGSNYENALMTFITSNYDPKNPTSCTPPKNPHWHPSNNRIEKITVNTYTDKYGFCAQFDGDPANDVEPQSKVIVEATPEEIAEYDRTHPS